MLENIWNVKLQISSCIATTHLSDCIKINRSSMTKTWKAFETDLSLQVQNLHIWLVGQVSLSLSLSKLVIINPIKRTLKTYTLKWKSLIPFSTLDLNPIKRRARKFQAGLMIYLFLSHLSKPTHHESTINRTELKVQEFYVL